MFSTHRESILQAGFQETRRDYPRRHSRIYHLPLMGEGGGETLVIFNAWSDEPWVNKGVAAVWASSRNPNAPVADAQSKKNPMTPQEIRHAFFQH